MICKRTVPSTGSVAIFMSANNKWVFIDTNILVYAHDVSAGSKHAHAIDLLASLWDSRSACISIQVLQEFYVTIAQKVPNVVDRTRAKDIVASLALWRTHTPNAEDIISAVEVQQRFQLSFWDAMIIHSAQRLGCSRLLSEDLNDGQMYDSVQVTNPFVES